MSRSLVSAPDPKVSNLNLEKLALALAKGMIDPKSLKVQIKKLEEEIKGLKNAF